MCTAFLLMLCVTGLPLIFHDEIDGWLVPPQPLAAIPAGTRPLDLDQLLAVVEAGCTEVLLDNMTDEEMTRAVGLVAGRATLEASGGITLERAPRIAATGVDFVSVGALTHSVTVFDLGLDFREPEPARPGS